MTGWTQDDVDRLRAAVASGILTVTYDGPPRRSITYQSLRDMRDLLADMTRDVRASDPGNSGVTTFRRVAFRKGLER